jgi:hypothetical protein
MQANQHQKVVSKTTNTPVSPSTKAAIVYKPATDKDYLAWANFLYSQYEKKGLRLTKNN